MRWIAPKATAAATTVHRPRKPPNLKHPTKSRIRRRGKRSQRRSFPLSRTNRLKRRRSPIRKQRQKIKSLIQAKRPLRDQPTNNPSNLTHDTRSLRQPSKRQRTIRQQSFSCKGRFSRRSRRPREPRHHHPRVARVGCGTRRNRKSRWRGKAVHWMPEGGRPRKLPCPQLPSPASKAQPIRRHRQIPRLPNRAPGRPRRILQSSQRAPTGIRSQHQQALRLRRRNSRRHPLAVAGVLSARPSPRSLQWPEHRCRHSVRRPTSLSIHLLWP